MVVQDEINIQESSINQQFNNIMSAMLCTGAAFVTKTLHLLTFRILEPYTSKGIELDLSQVTGAKLEGEKREVSPALFRKLKKSALILGENSLIASINGLISHYKCNF